MRRRRACCRHDLHTKKDDVRSAERSANARLARDVEAMIAAWQVLLKCVREDANRIRSRSSGLVT